MEGHLAEEEQDFAALANALVVKDAEQYYRNMYFGGETEATPLHSVPPDLWNTYLSFRRSLAYVLDPRYLHQQLPSFEGKL